MVNLLRKVRSYVRREGRMTPGQQQTFAQQWQVYGIDFPAPEKKLENWQQTFSREAPLAIDIGFGNGESTVALALAHPEWNIIAIEVYRAGIAQLLRQLAENNIHNVRVFCHDAVEVLQTAIPAKSVQRVQLFFPDPWQKKRHHKRRLVQPEFVQLISNCLMPQGEFALATDWEHYAQHMLEILSMQTELKNKNEKGFAERDPLRPITKFERRGHEAGHHVWDLNFKKV